MSLEFRQLDLPGCYVGRIPSSADRRGRFVKPFQASHFAPTGFVESVTEVYLSWSVKGTIRGLHFQSPPQDHIKAVACLQGEILDVMVDIRTNSPTFRKAIGIDLRGSDPHVAIIPKGVAHGFAALSDQALVSYFVTSEHAPDHDQGILWSSIDFAWPVSQPIISDRDREFPPLSDFSSPF